MLGKTSVQTKVWSDKISSLHQKRRRISFTYASTHNILSYIWTKTACTTSRFMKHTFMHASVLKKWLHGRLTTNTRWFSCEVVSPTGNFARQFTRWKFNSFFAYFHTQNILLLLYRKLHQFLLSFVEDFTFFFQESKQLYLFFNINCH